MPSAYTNLVKSENLSECYLMARLCATKFKYAYLLSTFDIMDTFK